MLIYIEENVTKIDEVNEKEHLGNETQAEGNRKCYQVPHFVKGKTLLVMYKVGG